MQNEVPEPPSLLDYTLHKEEYGISKKEFQAWTRRQNNMQGPLASDPERGGSKQGAYPFPRNDAAGKHDQAARRNAGRQCSTCRSQAVHKGIPASIQRRHLAAEEIHFLR